MAVDYHPYWFLTVFLIAAIGFAVVPLLLAQWWVRAFAPKKSGPQKNAIYECGLESKGDAWIQFHSDYYIYGVIFLIFDVETLFLFPFAVAYSGLPTGALIAMLVFIVLLVEGLVWAWRKGVLTWK